MEKIFFVTFVFFATQSNSQSIQPGLWKSKESFELAGLKMPSTSGEECISAGQAKDARSTIAKELNKQGCSVTKWTIKNKQLDASIICKNDNLDAAGELHGAFSKKNYDLKGEVKGKFKKAIPAVAKINLKGQWVKDCTVQ